LYSGFNGWMLREEGRGKRKEARNKKEEKRFF
jgi:hypothetical protein